MDERLLSMFGATGAHQMFTTPIQNNFVKLSRKLPAEYRLSTIIINYLLKFISTMANKPASSTFAKKRSPKNTNQQKKTYPQTSSNHINQFPKEIKNLRLLRCFAASRLLVRHRQPSSPKPCSTGGAAEGGGRHDALGVGGGDFVGFFCPTAVVANKGFEVLTCFFGLVFRCGFDFVCFLCFVEESGRMVWGWFCSCRVANRL